MKRRIFSVFMAFLMIFALMPGIMFAADDEASLQIPTRDDDPIGMIETLFTCPVFAAAVAQELNKAQNVEVTQGELNTISSITATGVSSVEGVQYLGGLEELILTNGTISDLSPFAGIQGRGRSLTHLDLSYNNISDLSGDPSTEMLNGGSFSPLLSLVNLEYLNISHNHITDFRPLFSLQQQLNNSNIRRQTSQSINFSRIEVVTLWPQIIVLSMEWQNPLVHAIPVFEPTATYSTPLLPSPVTEEQPLIVPYIQISNQGSFIFVEEDIVYGEMDTLNGEEFNAAELYIRETLRHLRIQWENLDMSTREVSYSFSSLPTEANSDGVWVQWGAGAKQGQLIPPNEYIYITSPSSSTVPLSM